MTERLAIVGARDASPETLEKVREYVRGLPEGTIVVSGGAVGVDSIADEAAAERGLGLIVYRPSSVDADAIIREAFRIQRVDHFASIKIPFRCDARVRLLYRNTLIAGCCTRMVAFVEGSKGGTWDAVKQAERFKRPVEVVR
jgi:predicted Rossmann fold nucleotide-binding protein DprA/Smf involved in DNA uptake